MEKKARITLSKNREKKTKQRTVVPISVLIKELIRMLSSTGTDIVSTTGIKHGNVISKVKMIPSSFGRVVYEIHCKTCDKNILDKPAGDSRQD